MRPCLLTIGCAAILAATLLVPWSLEVREAALLPGAMSAAESAELTGASDCEPGEYKISFCSDTGMACSPKEEEDCEGACDRCSDPAATNRMCFPNPCLISTCLVVTPETAGCGLQYDGASCHYDEQEEECTCAGGTITETPCTRFRDTNC